MEYVPTDRSSRDALKAIYRIVVALAITEGIRRAVLKDGSFAGLDALLRPPAVLFWGFLPTIVRFAHGASIHLDAPAGPPGKRFFDFLGFVMQGVLFFLTSLSLGDPRLFALFTGTLLLFDALWLLGLWLLGFAKPDRTWLQWVVSDIALIALVAGNNCALGNSHLFLVAILVVAAVLDYWMNFSFYFPSPTSQSEAPASPSA